MGQTVECPEHAPWFCWSSENFRNQQPKDVRDKHESCFRQRCEVRVALGEKSILDETTTMRVGNGRNLLGLARYHILKWALLGKLIE